MRNYDVSLIFSPLLAEQEVNDILQKLASLIQEKGGILGDQQIRGKRPLLAPIKKQKEGYLVTLAFTLAPEQLEGFEKECKENQHILRFLIAKQAKKRFKGGPRITLKQPLIANALSQPKPKEKIPATIASSVEEKREEKIDLKDIDEKLEEIFKETP